MIGHGQSFRPDDDSTHAPQSSSDTARGEDFIKASPPLTSRSGVGREVRSLSTRTRLQSTTSGIRRRQGHSWFPMMVKLKYQQVTLGQ
ncbi:hypothetical protein RRG08_000700 [Elysia crispata]|uniref:Uncharacterized protein n=1 Tax=Elysia crispata TaxID=231223 RepID=A0AAE1E296_9GAST|nr:hypothetical protein RRG08_000700 [Elysia crispata]